jgi:hypothetical protein
VSQSISGSQIGINQIIEHLVVDGGINFGPVTIGQPPAAPVQEAAKAVASPVDTILLLSAEPEDQDRLRLGEEAREIRETLRGARERERFAVESRTSVRVRDLTQALLDLRPRVVHFSGHGGEDGLCFEDDMGGSQVAPPDALAALFASLSHPVECVVLNACYSEPQARAISRHVPFVVGMEGPVSDRAAISFSIGFYQALGAGLDVRRAFQQGFGQVRLEGYAEGLTPVLCKRG